MSLAKTAFLYTWIGSAVIACESPRAATDQPPVENVTIAEPMLELGVKDELERVASAVRLANGSFVVADAFSASILFFDKSGTHYRTVGRAGGGPNEFRTPGWIGRCGNDSLFVFDPTLIRFSVLDSAGHIVRLFAAPNMTMLSCVDGLIAGFAPPSRMRLPNPKGPRERVKAQIQIIDTKGNLKAMTDTVPLGELGPLSKVSSLALTEDALWLGTGDSAYLDIYGMNGKRKRGVPIPIERVRATKNHWASDIDQQLSGTKDKRTQEHNRKLMEKFSLPEFLPVYRQIGADPRGGVWVANSVPGDSTTTLRIVNKDGGVVANLTISRVARILEVGKDYFLTSYEVDGQPRVGVYSFAADIIAFH